MLGGRGYQRELGLVESAGISQTEGGGRGGEGILDGKISINPGIEV